MKEREARLIKISVANVKFSEGRQDKTHGGSAVCLPKKPPNITGIPQEFQRHKSKKSINENINIGNTSQERIDMAEEKPREASRPRQMHLLRKPKPKPLRQRQEPPNNRSTREAYMLRTR